MKERIEYLEKRLAELKAEYEKNQKPEQPERWQDKLVQPINDDYFYIYSHATHGFTIEEAYDEDRKPEHAFATREQAELIKEKMLLMQEMHAFAHVRNEGWVADYNDDDQVKWGIVFKSAFKVDFYWEPNFFTFGISVKTKEIAKEMLKIFGYRIRKYYNQQY